MNAFAALADDTRRGIVALLAKKGELSATEISRNFRMSPPAISQHLKVLRQAKVLSLKKDAQRRLYSFSQAGIAEIETWLHDIKAWNQRLDRLEGYLLKLHREKAHAKKQR